MIAVTEERVPSIEHPAGGGASAELKVAMGGLSGAINRAIGVVLERLHVDMNGLHLTEGQLVQAVISRVGKDVGERNWNDEVGTLTIDAASILDTVEREIGLLKEAADAAERAVSSATGPARVQQRTSLLARFLTGDLTIASLKSLAASVLY